MTMRLSFFAALLILVSCLTARAESPTTATQQIDAHVSQLVRDVTRRVARMRGLSAEKPIAYEIIDGRQLRDVLQEAIDKQLPPETLPYLEFTMRRLGLMTEKQSLTEILMALLGEQVAGLYDQHGERLYVISTFNLKTTIAEIIMAHEICHALQDQHYDISRMPLEEPHNDDAAYAALSVLEGDATLTMNEYAARHIRLGRVLFDLPGMMGTMSNQKALGETPYFLQQQLLFPYVQGALFYEKVMRSNKRNEVLADYPRSTEQILHPEKYFRDKPEEPIRLPLETLDDAAPKRWVRRYHNIMGEMGTRLALEANFHPAAVKAAAGWGGDLYALYTPKRAKPGKGDHAFVWWTRWDTARDAIEFAEAMKKVARERLYEGGTMSGDQGEWTFEKDGKVALLRVVGKDVYYVDASSTKVAEGFLPDIARIDD